MLLNGGETPHPSRRPGRRLAPRRFGVLALAAVIAILLAAASSGRISATRVHFSLGRSTYRTLAVTVQGTVSSDIPSADVFMQAIIAQNGQLAWQQLCPVLQAKVPVSALANVVNSDSSINQGVSLQLDAVGSHTWSNGGAIRVYVVTAHRPSSADVRMLFVLRTQASGCIDGILSA